MRNIIHSESLATKRPTERGSVLVVALMCLLALFAITFAATKIRVASARDVEDQNTQATQYWQARSGAATIQASLITDIPTVFDAEMLRAQIAVAGYPLPHSILRILLPISADRCSTQTGRSRIAMPVTVPACLEI